MPSTKGSKTKKRSKKTSLASNSTHLDKTRSRGIFDQSLKGETFGPHPGYVDLKIRISIYNSITQQEERLPDKGIEMLVSSIEDVDEMLRIITRSLEDWVSGMSPYQ